MGFLFPWQEAQSLYGETGGGFLTGQDGVYTSSASPVDIFFPNAKQHPRFAGVKAQSAVLAAGEALVVPSGWWFSSVALEPSVTLQHPFWNLENRRYLVGQIRDYVDWE